MKTKLVWVMLLALLMGCSDDDEQGGNEELSYSYDFSSGAEGWTADFADYPAGEEEAYELEFAHTALPDPLDNSQNALMLSGQNFSDDLFMFVKKELTGLMPNQEYELTFEVEFASNESQGQSGIGGSPGESVYIKVGAATEEPEKQEDEEGWYRLDIDKGNQAEGGENMVVIGNFANDTDENIYTLKTLSNPNPVSATTGSDGSLWLLVGTDSGFEGKTTIYINRIKVDLN